MRLFDPAQAGPEDWPNGCEAERRYIEAVARLTPAGVARNVETRWLALATENRLLPVTVNEGGARGRSYVCQPSVAYVDYGLREMELVGLPGHQLLRPPIAAVGALLRAAGLDRIVHIDNWLLSTNLHGNWAGEGIDAVRALLAARFPSHILAVRSVDPWSSQGLTEALSRDGWVMLPSRQIWVTENLARDFDPRTAVRKDRRLLARSGLVAETLGREMSEADATRIAELYRQLYLGRYSTLNPEFTPAFLSAMQAAGVFRHIVAREPSGRIMAVAALFARNGVATAPVLGYDTSEPPSRGLYRIATLTFAERAMREGLRRHGSAGASHFKKLRGARPVIEFWAMQVDHLPAATRAAVRALAAALERFVVPMMRRREY